MHVTDLLKDDCIELIGIVLKWGLSPLYGVFTLTKTETEKYMACIKLFRSVYTD